MSEKGITVKLYHRVGKKRYLKGKYLYQHDRIYLPIPSKLHDTIKPFLNQQLKIDVTDKDGVFIITLNPAKTIRHAEQPSQKPPS